jgi:hypothetical protein
MTKPISEWADDELRGIVRMDYPGPSSVALAAELLRLREAHEAGCCVSEGWCDEATAMRGNLTRRAEKAEAELADARAEIKRQQRNTMEALAEADEYSAELDRTVVQLEKTMARESKAEAELARRDAAIVERHNEAINRRENGL